ncbi:MAG: hypothetical protein WA421_02525 [Nitrososphaeraceae archaeon]
MTITLVANSLGQLQVNTEDYSSNYYAIDKVSVRSDVPRKYYERRIRQFLDFVKSDLEEYDIENRPNAFAYTANQEIKPAVEHVIRFLKYQKSRVENGNITAAATLRNYVKAIKSFCDVCGVTIPWKKITRGLPRGKSSMRG